MAKKVPEFIPIWRFCKINKTSRQNVYRWIREGKVPADKLKTVEKLVKRIYIDSSFQNGKNA